MPLSVRAALVLAFVVALVGAVSASSWIADAWGDGAATRSLAALPGLALALERAGSPLYLLAAAVVPIVLRRDARLARIAFQLSLLAAITLAAMASGLASPGGLRVDAGLAAMLALAALVGGLAFALSRPSARAWFGSR
jgi:ubiquinone biosynthesis protein UbiJ